MMSLDKETPVKLSPVFTVPASLSDQPQLNKPRPLLSSRNGLAAPPPVGHRVGKRRYSMGVGFRGAAKRRRRANSDGQAEPVLPNHFLLGGNIFDPLNLNSLLDEDVNRATNQETPKCSPLPSKNRDPVEILVPRDITDPLNLKEGGDVASVLLSPHKPRRRHRYRHHGGGGGDADREAVPPQLFPPPISTLTGDVSVSASPLSCELNTAITCRDDLAPAPILPRRHTHPPQGSAQKAGGHRKRRRTTSTRSTDGPSGSAAPPSQPAKFQTPLTGGAKAGRCKKVNEPQKKKKDKHRYQYGNHSRYYGYQGFYGDPYEGRVGAEKDPRLRLLEADWFKDKTVLDVGCGAGNVTLSIARRFNPAHILGVELDPHLVRAAQQNIRHFLSHDLVVEERARREREEDGEKAENENKETKAETVMEMQKVLSMLSFPLSFRVSRGPIAAPPLHPPPSASSRFPSNITFIQGDYVSDQEVWPGRGHYDVIVCLSLTKWVQLQGGDEGVVRLFKRAYQSLSPGGLFILEPQPWSSYIHSKRASEKTLRNFKNLRLRPEQFTSYLTDNVGFSSYRLLNNTGNQRPIYLFHKGSAHKK